MADYWLSTTDPDATMMNSKGEGTRLGYHTHYVVDGGKARIIMAVLVTPSEVMENQPVLDLLWRVRFRWKLWPRQFTGDTTYGSAEIITALEQQHLRPYVPLADFDQRTGFFGQRDFSYDAEHDRYICPNGAELRLLPSGCTDQFKQYRAKASICNACPLKARCTTSKTGRRISRHVAEDSFERVRAFHQTAAYKKAMNKRKVWVEPLFAEAKDWHGLRRFRLRERWRVNCEGLRIATGQNLKRLLRKRGWGRRPFPAEALCAFFLATYLFSWKRVLFPRCFAQLIEWARVDAFPSADELRKRLFQQAVLLYPMFTLTMENILSIKRLY
jgi:Transposase DDE domain